MIMRATKAFSLMETLVAVILASITALALLQALSSSSKHSAHILQTYDDALMAGLATSNILNNINVNISLYDVIRERYSIDNSDIETSLKAYTFSIKRSPVEIIDPMHGSVIRTGNGDSLSGYTLSLQKNQIENDNVHKTFFRISGGTP